MRCWCRIPFRVPVVTCLNHPIASVLAHQAAITSYHRPGEAYRQQKWLLTALGQAVEDCLLIPWRVRACFLVLSTAAFWPCPQAVEGTGMLPGVSFIRTLTPFMRAPPSWPNHLPKAAPPNAITLELKDLTSEFWEDRNIQSQKLSWD